MLGTVPPSSGPPVGSVKNLGSNHHLQDVERKPVRVGGRSEVRADIMARHRDCSPESMGGGQCLDHGGRERSPLGTVTCLEHGHRPGDLPEAEHPDRGGESNELGTKPRLEVLRQRRDGSRQLADHAVIGE